MHASSNPTVLPVLYSLIACFAWQVGLLLFTIMHMITHFYMFIVYF